MKDEEMADKHAEEYVMREDVITENDKVPFDNGYGFQTISFEDEVKKGYKDGFLAGLKAGRPQWHTPDVPTSPINKVVLGYIKHYNSKQFCLVGWNGEWWYDAGTYNDEVKLIAWCEIPTFDKE